MAEGQFTGSRSAYVYTHEAGGLYILQLDDTLAAIPGLALDPYTGQATAKPAPRRFRPRIVYWESTDGQYRKQLVAGKSTATLYSKEGSTGQTIDGIDGFTTGRRGEKLTFVKAKDPG